MRLRNANPIFTLVLRNAIPTSTLRASQVCIPVALRATNYSQPRIYSMQSLHLRNVIPMFTLCALYCHTHVYSTCSPGLLPVAPQATIYFQPYIYSMRSLCLCNAPIFTLCACHVYVPIALWAPHLSCAFSTERVSSTCFPGPCTCRSIGSASTHTFSSNVHGSDI
jgi:hypothetical protein